MQDFQELIKIAKIRNGIKSRDLPALLGMRSVTLSYETLRNLPEYRLIRLASVLNLDEQDVLSAAGRVPDFVVEYLKKNPSVLKNLIKKIKKHKD